jgi:tetratricopeptide (TPR) repeat protein
MGDLLPRAVLAALVVTAALPVESAAEPSRERRADAKKLYRAGVRYYNVGEYDRAIEKFKASYLLVNSPLLLFNIAQAQRLKGDCDQALRSYRAYLREEPEEEKEVADAIAICEAKLAKERPAPEPAEGRSETRTASASPIQEQPRAQPNAVARTAPERPEPRLLVARAAVGPAFASIGEVEPGLLVSFAASGGYPFRAGAFTFEPGLALSYTPVPWESNSAEVGPASGTTRMTGILADLSIAWPATRRLSFLARAGAGVLVLTGLAVDGNPFLNPDEFASGSIGLPHARLAFGLELDLTRHFYLNAVPALSYSPPGGLNENISSLLRVDFLVGAALKL